MNLLAALVTMNLIVAMGGVTLESLSVTDAAIDITTEWQDVELREALTAQTGNPRLIVYIRNLESVGLDRKGLTKQLPLVFPESSIQALAINKQGESYALALTGYSFYRGLPGLVLEDDAVPRGETFYKLSIRSKTPIKGASLIWLDSFGRSRPE